jgi:hypothetical protein
MARSFARLGRPPLPAGRTGIRGDGADRNGPANGDRVRDGGAISVGELRGRMPRPAPFRSDFYRAQRSVMRIPNGRGPVAASDVLLLKRPVLPPSRPAPVSAGPPGRVHLSPVARSEENVVTEQPRPVPAVALQSDPAGATERTRSCSFMARGCCRAVGTTGRISSSRPAAPPCCCGQRVEDLVEHGRSKITPVRLTRVDNVAGRLGAPSIHGGRRAPSPLKE